MPDMSTRRCGDPLCDGFIAPGASPRRKYCGGRRILKTNGEIKTRCNNRRVIDKAHIPADEDSLNRIRLLIWRRSADDDLSPREINALAHAASMIGMTRSEPETVDFRTAIKEVLEESTREVDRQDVKDRIDEARKDIGISDG